MVAVEVQRRHREVRAVQGALPRKVSAYLRFIFRLWRNRAVIYRRCFRRRKRLSMSISFGLHASRPGSSEAPTTRPGEEWSESGAKPGVVTLRTQLADWVCMQVQ
jgi:hypothetical protein